MKQYPATQIKNLALLGHASSGKTTLAEAMLFSSGITERMGRIDDGSTLMDFDAEEKKRKASLSTSLYQFETNGIKINLIDAPGLFDFAGGVCEALFAADSAVLVLSGKSGLNVGAKLSFEQARRLKKPCAFFISKLDSSRSYFYRVLSTLTGQYGAIVCPAVVPYLEGDQVVCYVNLITNKAYKFDGIKASEVAVPQSEEISHMRNIMLEAIASADEALMTKYFDGEEFTENEIISGLSLGVESGDICPVFCGVGQTGEGVPLFMELITKIMPSAASVEYEIKKGDAVGKLGCNDSSPAAAVVFKTIADPFVGKLSFFKVVSGKIKSDIKLINSRTDAEERLGKVMWIKGGKQEDADYIGAGDIGAVAKLGNVITGDTLYSQGNKMAVVTVDFPTPCLSLAVSPKAKGDEEKIAAGLVRLMEEDPTIRFYINNETHEQIISGLGEQHIDVVASKLKSKFGVEIDLKTPKVPYRETITKKVRVQGRHKKQSGGHGQFGDVWIEFEPCDSDDLVFEEKVFGGSVPKNFFPAVEKGLRDSISKGSLAGYPVVGVRATLVDGSYHPVDSSEMSFKMAAAMAFKAGIPQASPVLLEPIGTLSVIVPDDIMGDVIGDINKRRGRVLGMNPAEDRMQEIVAEVPVSEMGDFSTAMRAVAQGRATYNFVFARYDEAPSMIAQKIIAESNVGD
ncbi:MAG: elongation factor G [Oscillospiraceae bacterium]|nr:elongation factor G [Oscillospiraceae bacterium]